MISLYDDQVEIVRNMGMALRSNNRVLMQAATGAGKSVMAAYMIERILRHGASVMFVVPRRELVRQISDTLCKFSIEHTFIAADYPYNPAVKCAIASTDTLIRRLPTAVPYNYIFIDEAHFGRNKNVKIINGRRGEHGKKIIGLSATPTDSHNISMSSMYDTIVEGRSVRWLIDNGRLSDYRLFAPSHVDTSSLPKRHGDYAKKDLSAFMMEHKAIIGNAAEHYLKLAKGKRAVTFTVSRAHSEIIRQKYMEAGIPCAIIDGNTPEAERKAMALALAKREIHHLINVSILTFGYDLAAAAGMDVTVECVVDLAPTQSTANQMQKWGRALRKKDNPAIILDHVGNCYIHGRPCDDRSWDLGAGTKKGAGGTTRYGDVEVEADVKSRVCPNCHYSHRPEPSCPECGYVYPNDGRKLAEYDGVLAEYERAERKHADEINAKRRKRVRQKIAFAKTKSDLREIASELGYSNGWVYKMAAIKGIRK